MMRSVTSLRIALGVALGLGFSLGAQTVPPSYPGEATQVPSSEPAHLSDSPDPSVKSGVIALPPQVTQGLWRQFQRQLETLMPTDSTAPKKDS